MNKLVGVSLFSGAGIGEFYFKKTNTRIALANELIKCRSELYSFFYPRTKMLNGDFTNPEVFSNILNNIKKYKCNFLIATPPCQGMSTLGKKKYRQDERNLLIFHVLHLIDLCDFDYIIIENVPKFLNMIFSWENSYKTINEILVSKYGKFYNIDGKVYNAKDYSVPQNRKRAIIKMWKKDKIWKDPKKGKIITLKKAIGKLPSIESGEISNIKNHFAKLHNSKDILAMKHTPEGCSAMKNKFFFPRTVNGKKIKGFHNTYKRMKWDEPSPTRAMNNGNIGGHNNVHPGRKLKSGLYSDARVLTLRELFIVSSLPANLTLPEWCSDNLIRQVIGESVPPKLLENIIKGIMW